MIIAIDGPSASGKGTLARRLAEHFNFAHLDTGKIYRAVGLEVIRNGGDILNSVDALTAAKLLKPSALKDIELIGDEAAAAASRVATMPAVRAALLEFQREFAAEPPHDAKGAILDGRDIGTVVCPKAAIKLFVTANVNVRAKRRHKELLERGERSIYSRVLNDLRERDKRDSSRDIAPLEPAVGAFILDTSDLNAEQTFNTALLEIERHGC